MLGVSLFRGQDMADSEDPSGHMAAELQRRFTLALHSLEQIKTDLRLVQARLTPGQFTSWAWTEAGLDTLTLHDVLCFDGTMEGLTEHMLRWVRTLHDRGRFS
jgi:hypothetical protein